MKRQFITLSIINILLSHEPSLYASNHGHPQKNQLQAQHNSQNAAKLSESSQKQASTSPNYSASDDRAIDKHSGNNIAFQTNQPTTPVQSALVPRSIFNGDTNGDDDILPFLAAKLAILNTQENHSNNLPSAPSTILTSTQYPLSETSYPNSSLSQLFPFNPKNNPSLELALSQIKNNRRNNIPSASSTILTSAQHQLSELEEARLFKYDMIIDVIANQARHLGKTNSRQNENYHDIFIHTYLRKELEALKIDREKIFNYFYLHRGFQNLDDYIKSEYKNGVAEREYQNRVAEREYQNRVAEREYQNRVTKSSETSLFALIERIVHSQDDPNHKTKKDIPPIQFKPAPKIGGPNSLKYLQQEQTTHKPDNPNTFHQLKK